jgi:NADPH:quinone reductase-like Zn-dependent oxidoreductase
MLALSELLDTGQVAPVIDHAYALDDLAAALRYLGEGHALGKVVVTM